MIKGLVTKNGARRCLSCGEIATEKVTVHDSEFYSCIDCVEVVRSNYLMTLFTGKDTGLIYIFKANRSFRKKKNLIRDNKIRVKNGKKR